MNNSKIKEILEKLSDVKKQLKNSQHHNAILRQKKLNEKILKTLEKVLDYLREKENVRNKN